MKNVLVTCPPMLGQIDRFYEYATQRGVKLYPVKATQILSEEELKAMLPNYDGWIIGDDPATRTVLESGQNGRLKAAVKWGIGVDNVDFAACKDLGIPIINTPQIFGAEVADVGLAFVIGLARELFLIDRSVRAGKWIKPAGISLLGKRAGVVGFGDIGRNLATRLMALGLDVVAYDPGVKNDQGIVGVRRAAWPVDVEDLDFIIFTCALNAYNFHMLDAKVLKRCKDGIRIVNVARGPLIDETALISALQSGKVHSVALDVFEVEPLPDDSPLRHMERCILSTHNSSNTIDAVIRASHEAINKIANFLRQA